jgi:hypothetical protein
VGTIGDVVGLVVGALLGFIEGLELRVGEFEMVGEADGDALVDGLLLGRWEGETVGLLLGDFVVVVGLELVVGALVMDGEDDGDMLVDGLLLG